MSSSTGKPALGGVPSRLRRLLLVSWFFLEHVLGSAHAWWGICLCCAGILTYAARYSMNPDGLTYLDLASEVVSGGPSKLVNGLWSPGYPALISVAILLFRPSSAQEFPLIHFVNFLMFVFALTGFSVFLRYSLKTMSDDAAVNESKNTYFKPFAFSTFLLFTLKYIGVEVATPDLGVAAIVFLAAGISCRLYLPDPSWKHFLALGLVLGVGYYFKAAVLPLGVALLALLFLLLPLSKKHISRQKLVLSLLLSLSVFLLVSAPLVAALSFRANTLSFGEAGRLNYAWHVNRLLWTGGQEPPEENTTLEHPARKLLTTPMTLEFATPISGTYPIWYDPSYWYAHAIARFDVRQQIAALILSWRVYKSTMEETMAYTAGAIVLLVLGDYKRRNIVIAIARKLWWQLLWAFVACSMFALVHVEPRYVGAFLVLFWVALYGALLPGVERRVKFAVLATVLCTVIVPFLGYVAMTSMRIARDLAHPKLPEYQTAGVGLSDLGLQKGDRLAVVGYAYNCYYARFARLRVVAQIPDTKEFWRLSTAELKVVTERLASIGVKAVVASNGPDTPGLAEWKDVQVSDSLRLRVLLLSPDVLGKIH